MISNAGYACFYCNTVTFHEGGDQQLHFDHYIAKSLGGGNEPANMVPSCRSCNLSKGALPIEYWRERCFDEAYKAITRLYWLIGVAGVFRIADVIGFYARNTPTFLKEPPCPIGGKRIIE